MNTGTTGTYGTATHTAVDPVTTNTAPATTTTTGPHRGPIRAAEDALMGGVTGTTKTQTGAGTGAGVGTGAGHGLAAGTGAGGMGTTGVTGTHNGAHGAGVRPSAGQRIVGEAEKLVGHVVGNPTMVARGQEKKTGMPATVQNTGGVGTTNAASGPGLGGGRVL